MEEKPIATSFTIRVQGSDTKWILYKRMKKEVKSEAGQFMWNEQTEH